MAISKIMKSQVVAVDMDHTIRRVNELFASNEFHHLLVLEDNKLVGIISDRDLFKSLSPRIGTPAETLQDTALLNKKAHQIMTRNPIVINQKAAVQDAIEIFNQNKISCIPVVNDEHIPVGILSWRDIMRLLVKPTTK
jgi:acetoin utilization protein AcuB